MQVIDILTYVSECDLSRFRKILVDGQDKVIYEDNSIKITLKKRGKRIYTFVDEYGQKSVNKALNEIVKLV